MPSSKFYTDINQIEDWLENHATLGPIAKGYGPATKEYFNIKPNGEVDVVNFHGGRVVLDAVETPSIPVKFGNCEASFAIGWSGIETLIGCPKSTVHFSCYHNPHLKSLQGGPILVNGDYKTHHNASVTSLDGIPKVINGNFEIDYTYNLPLLRLFYVRDLEKLKFWVKEKSEISAAVEIIINRYLPMGVAGIIPCAAELNKSGFKGNARL